MSGTRSALWTTATPGLAALAVAAAYLGATQPMLLNGKGALGRMLAAGGNIDAIHYLQLLLIAGAVSVIFVLAGYLACRATGFLNIAALALPDAGVFFYVGMALFLTLATSLAVTTGAARESTAATLVMMTAGGLYGVWRAPAIARGPRHLGVAVAWLPVLVSVLCLAHYVITQRGGGGTGWFYADLARHITTENTMPVVNRHYGQSVLASIGLSVVGVGADRFTYPQVALDAWLFASQIALALVFFRALMALGVSEAGCYVGAFILMFGGTALSLVPHIVYDHDYPFVFNVYTDSLFGIAGWLILVLYLLDRVAAANRLAPAAWAAMAVPALVVATFNATAELNILIALLLVACLLLLNAIPTERTIPPSELALLLVLLMVAAGLGSLLGGVFAGRTTSAERAAASPFWEAAADADSARMSISDPRWYYLPHVVLGLPTGFGNLPAPAAMAPGAAADSRPSLETPGSPNVTSANGRLLDRFQGTTKPAVYDFLDPWYLAELRIYQAARVIWFPIAGLAGLGWLVARRASPPGAGFFWRLALVAFAAGVGGVVLSNSPGGDAFYWKWGLTRLLEPGLCLAMIAFVMAADVVISPRPTRYVLWAMLTLLMTASTLLRIVAFPSLVG